MTEKQYEILALTLRYWFVLLILYIFVKSAVRTFRDLLTGSKSRRSTGNIPFILVLFTLTAFGLLALQDPAGFNMDTALLGILISAVILFQFYFLYNLFEGMDEVILLIVDTLAVLGFVMLQRLTPELALRQVEWFTAGCVILFLTMLVVSRLKINHLGKLINALMLLGPIILFLVAFFGEESGGATSKVPLGSLSIQPAEFVKMIFVLVLANALDHKKSFHEKIPLFLFVAFSILGVVLQKDLGSALHFFLVFLFIYQISTNDWIVSLSAAGAGILASIVSYRIFSHVRVRVEAWKNPWADVGGKGWQVAQSLIAMGSGGLIGLGLGMGTPYIIPASRTDFIFAAICEELGILTGGMVIGFYVLILIRSMQKAYRAHHNFDMLLACGSAVSLGMQAFIIIGGVVKMIPLTGITLPFVSYGGSSMIVSLCIIGLIQSVSIKNERFVEDMAEYDGEYQVEEYEGNNISDEADNDFTGQGMEGKTKYLKRNIRNALLILMSIFLMLTIYFYYNLYIYSERWFSDPNNARVRVDMVNPDIIPGSIMDRNHKVLVVTKSSAGQNSTIYYRDYHKDSRYAAHIVGSRKYGIGAEVLYVKYLLGYDNNLFERIYQKAFLEHEQGNNVILTIDIHLQKYIYQAMGEAKGSVVLMNPKTGEILAMVSKPSFNPAEENEEPAEESLLNKASYGRYPPGSVMKIITAAAALESTIDLDDYTVKCEGITEINGVTITCSGREAHGEINLLHAMEVSCNAYFAGLVQEIGWKQLKKTGEAFGFNRDFLFSDIKTTQSLLPLNRRTDAEELAWSGVGQGRVLTSPLHMAMIVSAIANRGEMPEPRLIYGIEPRSGKIRLQDSSILANPISDETSRAITDIMINVVENGTGSRAHTTGMLTAGKTGTAETGSDKKPHAWFVGFAPADNPTLAISVILENTGAGGRNAAPLAGKILREARKLGY